MQPFIMKSCIFIMLLFYYTPHAMSRFSLFIHIVYFYQNFEFQENTIFIIEALFSKKHLFLIVFL